MIYVIINTQGGIGAFLYKAVYIKGVRNWQRIIKVSTVKQAKKRL